MVCLYLCEHSSPTVQSSAPMRAQVVVAARVGDGAGGEIWSLDSGYAYENAVHINRAFVSNARPCL